MNQPWIYMCSPSRSPLPPPSPSHPSGSSQCTSPEHFNWIWRIFLSVKSFILLKYIYILSFEFLVLLDGFSPCKLNMLFSRCSSKMYWLTLHRVWMQYISFIWSMREENCHSVDRIHRICPRAASTCWMKSRIMIRMCPLRFSRKGWNITEQEQ